MRVRIRRMIAGPTYVFGEGHEMDVSDALGRAWCDGPDPVAEPVGTVRSEPMETAMVSPAETAVRRPRRRA